MTVFSKCALVMIYFLAEMSLKDMYEDPQGVGDERPSPQTQWSYLTQVPNDAPLFDTGMVVWLEIPVIFREFDECDGWMDGLADG